MYYTLESATFTNINGWKAGPNSTVVNLSTNSSSACRTLKAAKSYWKYIP